MLNLFSSVDQKRLRQAIGAQAFPGELQSQKKTAKDAKSAKEVMNYKSRYFPLP